MQGLVCIRSYAAVLGCILQDTNLLGDIERPLSNNDFNTDPFYELLFSAIYNLYAQGCQHIDALAIDSYISAYPSQYKIFQEDNGLEYINTISSVADVTNYDYYYHRVRKYSLLRFLESRGYDTRSIYNSTLTESGAIEKEQAKFDSYTEQDILEIVENELLTTPRMSYCTNTLTTSIQAGAGLNDLITELMQVPDVGLPFASYALNTITRGARKGCLYMRSAGSSVGKSRLAAADACGFAIPYVYNLETKKWEYTGISEPTLYITTEMEAEEIQTLICATVSGVNEEHILNGTYDKGELERVRQANQYIAESPLYIEHIPDFSIEDIKNIVKKYHRELNVDYFFFDYIHTSLRMMTEVGNKSKMSLKEYQLLTLFATEMKSLCQQLKVFMMTASQLSGDYDAALVKDQNLLAGAKGLCVKLDIGVICSRPTNSELQRIRKSVLSKRINYPVPNMCTWVYKVRRGRITRVVIWQFVDLGTMRIRDLFVTNINFELIDVDFTKIEHAEIVEQVLNENSVRLTDATANMPDDVDESEDENDTSKKIVGW